MNIEVQCTVLSASGAVYCLLRPTSIAAVLSYPACSPYRALPSRSQGSRLWGPVLRRNLLRTPVRAATRQPTVAV